LKRYATVAIAFAAGFAATVIVAMLSLEFFHMNEKGYLFDLVLYPSIVLGAVIVLGIAAGYVSSLFSKKTFKITMIAVASAIGAAFIALMVCLGVYFASGAAEINNGAQITVSENVALYLCAAGLIAVIALLAIFFGRKAKRGFDSKTISYAAVCIAMSFALSYLKLWKMPQGGSVTFASLLPLMIYAYMFGARKGVFAGLIYGILQAVQEPFLIHPAQFLLDYPIAFSAIGLAGMFGNLKKLDNLPQVQFALGAIVASALRFVAHVLSGVFAFSEYSTLDNVWIYSMGYNSFVFIDILIVIAVGALVFSSPTLVKQVRKFRPKETPEAESTPKNETT
ncbi:MAG: energy-coupled thiamine transporter ThiT, partial [Clostridia bacterium]|nr:energy-coupled thiamine transporter ThiT [Clostridia bacterium]